MTRTTKFCAVEKWQEPQNSMPLKNDKNHKILCRWKMTRTTKFCAVEKWQEPQNSVPLKNNKNHKILCVEKWQEPQNSVPLKNDKNHNILCRWKMTRTTKFCAVEKWQEPQNSWESPSLDVGPSTPHKFPCKVSSNLLQYSTPGFSEAPLKLQGLKWRTQW